MSPTPSGHGRDATVQGTADWSAAGQGLAFNGSDTYVKLPNDVLKGLNSVSVSMDVLIDAAQSTPYFLYGFGNSSGGNGNGYLFATGNSLRTSIATGNWSTEQTTRPADSHNLTRAVWKHLTYTQTGGTGVLYEDGVEVARNTAVTITPGAIGSGTTTANAIGRSVYSGDKLFKGRMRDFRVYDRALAKLRGRAARAPRGRAGRRRRQGGTQPGRHQRCDRRSGPAEDRHGQAARRSAGRATTRTWSPTPAR